MDRGSKLLACLCASVIIIIIICTSLPQVVCNKPWKRFRGGKPLAEKQDVPPTASVTAAFQSSDPFAAHLKTEVANQQATVGWRFVPNQRPDTNALFPDLRRHVKSTNDPFAPYWGKSTALQMRMASYAKDIPVCQETAWERDLESCMSERDYITKEFCERRALDKMVANNIDMVFEFKESFQDGVFTPFKPESIEHKPTELLNYKRLERCAKLVETLPSFESFDETIRKWLAVKNECLEYIRTRCSFIERELPEHKHDYPWLPVGSDQMHRQEDICAKVCKASLDW